jgi:hypothetical protein
MGTHTINAIKLIVVLFLLTICVGGCLQNQEKTESSVVTTIIKEFSVKNPSQAALKITNTSNSPVSFSLNLNGKPHYNKREMAEFVRGMSDEMVNEPLERKAWRFVRDNLKYNSAFSQEQWQHNPHLLLNSLGFGQCDDYASLLVQLWEELGFEARVWTLTGHVVSEVKANNKWQMFDAAYGVYYFNEDNLIAGVQELSSNINLIQYPIEMVAFGKKNDNYTQFSRYNSAIVNHYATQEDNAISEWIVKDVVEINPLIRIPENTTISLPLKNGGNQFQMLRNSIFVKETFISYVSVSIPKNITGIVRLPFVFAEVEGEGVVQINGREFNLGNFKPEISNFGFVSDIKVIENVTGINVTYFINPTLINMQYNNKLTLKVEVPNSIRIDTIPNKNLILNHINDSIISRNYDHLASPYISDSVAIKNFNHFIQKKGKWQKQLKDVETIQQLKEVIWVYYKIQENLTIEEQTAHMLRVSDYITYLIETKPENEELIVEISKRTDLMYFINIVESNEVDKVLLFLETIKTQMQGRKLE